jgi:hypothetical protein
MKLLLSLFLALLTTSMAEQPMITIRLSFKALRRPVTGDVQGFAVKDIMLNVVNEMNLAMDRAKRGLRFVYDDFDGAGQMIRVGDHLNNTSNPANPSYWSEVEPGDMNNFAVQANAHPVEFAFKSTHINIYLAVPIYGAAGARFPDEGGFSPAYNNFAVSGFGGAATYADNYARTMLHEMGHYFSLLHTFNTEVGTAVSGSTFGDDGFYDTLIDTAGSTINYGGALRGLDYFSDLNFSLTYAELNATQQGQALGEWRNFYAMRLFGITTYGGLSAAQKAHLDANQAAYYNSSSLLLRDLIAAANYNGPNNPQRIFNDPALPHLNTDEQLKVQSLLNNYMSYHRPTPVEATYTGQQLDAIADTMTFNGRLPVVSGRTFFLGYGPLFSSSAPLGSSRFPFATPSALASSTPSPTWTSNDQVLVRPGAYSGPVTFNKPMTLRVSSMTNGATNSLRTDQHATFGSSTNH